MTGPSNTVQHVYDGQLKRVKSIEDGETTYWIYSALTGTPIYSENITTGEVSQYLDSGGVRIQIVDGAVTWTHLDHQGSAIAATDSAGVMKWREHYTPFGEKLLDPTANKDRPGYTGHIQDDWSGLTYMQARYYDPTLGRFLQTDPIGYQDQLNLYAYVANDPVNVVDPDGKLRRWLVELVGDGMKKKKPITKKDAIKERQKGNNVYVEGDGGRSEAKSIETAAASHPDDVLRHGGHDLPGGKKGKPHYQNDRRRGHTFYDSAVNGVLVGLAFILDEIFWTQEVGCGVLDCDGDGLEDATGRPVGGEPSLGRVGESSSDPFNDLAEESSLVGNSSGQNPGETGGWSKRSAASCAHSNIAKGC